MSKEVNRRCTWVDCTQEAEHAQIGKDGSTWADLCGVHTKELEDAVSDKECRTILPAWVRASGGAKILAKRIVG